MNEVTVRVREYFFWSPMLGEDAVRFSLFDPHGQEFYSIQPLKSRGKNLREMRDAVGITLYEAMRSGRDPGEVH